MKLLAIILFNQGSTKDNPTKCPSETTDWPKSNEITTKCLTESRKPLKQKMKKRRDTPAPLTLNGAVNLGFTPDTNGRTISTIDMVMSSNDPEKNPQPEETTPAHERPQWSSGLEYLMTLIAMSVGLGNIWRFPFTAYENGGGAFLIPYIIVLVVIGRPLYLMEMALGQFTSKGIIQVWSFSPILKGVGYGQLFAQGCVLTYYCSLMALTLHYMFASFQTKLPWATCQPDWLDCFDSSTNFTEMSAANRTGLRSSSEHYFLKNVIHEKSSIHDGIGLPDAQLSLYLLISWILIFLVVSKGVKSTGKAAYFLTIFPYVVLIVLLVRAVTLPGAIDGIMFFITPQWEKLLDPTVWHTAVTQAFFSLSVCFASLIPYSSYSDFKHNIYRDAMIVTIMDTITSLTAGFTIFGILGNLALESGASDISQVTKGGAGLAFISYPEAITRFDVLPQLFSVAFFSMLFILGIGTAIAGVGSCVTIFTDRFPKLASWKVALPASIVGYCFGLIYLTPGGQYILNLVDYFAASFNVFILATLEAIAVFWIYGLDNFCTDVEFMLDRNMGVYWRVCWGLITPCLLFIIFAYSVASAQLVTYGSYVYPSSAYLAGWIVMAIGLAQLPLWGVYVIIKNRSQHRSLWHTIINCFKPSEAWGPSSPGRKKEWDQFRRKKTEEIMKSDESSIRRVFRILFNLKVKGS